MGSGVGTLEKSLDHETLEKLGIVITSDLAEIKPAGKVYYIGNAAHVRPDSQSLALKPKVAHLVVSTFSHDFTDLSKSTPELLRVMKPDATAILYLHHRDSIREGLERIRAQVSSIHRKMGGALTEDEVLSRLATGNKKFSLNRRWFSRRDSLVLSNFHFRNRLLKEGRIFENESDVRRFFESHGAEVVEVKTAANEDGEKWFEVVLRKPHS